MEHQVERLAARGQAELGDGRLLAGLQDRRAQLDVARLVDAVHVAERGRQQVAALLADAQRVHGRLVVGRRGVELLVDLVGDAVLLAADDADLDLEDDPRLRGLLQQIRGDLQVLVQRHRRAVPHVRLEQRVPAAVDPLAGQRDQRPDVGVELVLRAVVGVQRDVDRVLLGDDVGELGQRGGAGDHVLHPGAGAELRAAGGELDDPVASRLGEPAQRGVDGLRTRAVDRRVGVLAALGAVQHLVVDLGGRDRHGRALLDVVGFLSGSMSHPRRRRARSTGERESFGTGVPTGPGPRRPESRPLASTPPVPDSWTTAALCRSVDQQGTPGTPPVDHRLAPLRS